MKQRVLNGIAKAIAKNEKIIADKNATQEEVRAAMDAIKELTTQIESFEDLVTLDELIQSLM